MHNYELFMSFYIPRVKNFQFVTLNKKLIMVFLSELTRYRLGSFIT